MSDRPLKKFAPTTANGKGDRSRPGIKTLRTIMPKIEQNRNDAIDVLIDRTMKPLDWRDFQALRADSPATYRKTIATLGKLLAKQLTVRLDQRLASEVDYADF